VIASREVIVFAKADDKELSGRVIDAIPLFEVTEISFSQSGEDSCCPEDLNMKNEYEKRMNTPRSGSGTADSKKVKLRNDFHIRTFVNGYNSGRVYYLKSSNEAECEDIVRKLSESAKTARKAMEAKTRFETSQERVRSVYHSAFCQSIVALMIVVVWPPKSTFQTRSRSAGQQALGSIPSLPPNIPILKFSAPCSTACCPIPRLA
jgi:hypothetical protein